MHPSSHPTSGVPRVHISIWKSSLPCGQQGEALKPRATDGDLALFMPSMLGSQASLLSNCGLCPSSLLPGVTAEFSGANKSWVLFIHLAKRHSNWWVTWIQKEKKKHEKKSHDFLLIAAQLLQGGKRGAGSGRWQAACPLNSSRTGSTCCHREWQVIFVRCPWGTDVARNYKQLFVSWLGRAAALQGAQPRVIQQELVTAGLQRLCAVSAMHRGVFRSP